MIYSDNIFHYWLPNTYVSYAKKLLNDGAPLSQYRLTDIIKEVLKEPEFIYIHLLHDIADALKTYFRERSEDNIRKLLKDIGYIRNNTIYTHNGNLHSLLIDCQEYMEATKDVFLKLSLIHRSK